MNESLDWVISNKEVVIQLLTAVVSVASLIAALLPNKSPNKWIAASNKVVSWLALNVGNAKSKD
jgi:hypothetical protein